MAKNYYLILGITADASLNDIRTAFRRRALELHPDRSGLESGPFQELQEAYSVLGDAERRRQYDRERAMSSAMAQRAGSRAEPFRETHSAEPFRGVQPARGFREISLADSFEVYRPSFEELFDRLWSNFELFDRPKAERLESLTVEAVISPEEAQLGGRVRVWVPAQARCLTCGGYGRVGAYECWRCEGHGSLPTEYPTHVEYPAGLTDGYAVRIPLAQFGIGNFYLILLFRVSSGRD